MEKNKKFLELKVLSRRHGYYMATVKYKNESGQMVATPDRFFDEDGEEWRRHVYNNVHVCIFRKVVDVFVPQIFWKN